MRPPREPPCILGLIVCSLLSGCSGGVSDSPDRELGSSARPIIAGMPGGPASVGHVFPMTTPYDFCTGTLIAPDLVLTAKHCVFVGEDPTLGRLMDQDVVKFTLVNSNDPSRWTDAVRVVQLYLAPTLPPPPNETHYFMPDLASDVAVYRLAMPITSVAPLSIAREAPGPANVDFVTAGFGRTSHAGADATSRNIGTLTFALNGGSALQEKFPTLADYELAVTQVAPGASSTRLVDEYENEILAQDYEMLFDAPSNAQVCNGDSGDPLLQKDASGNYRAFGVASGSMSYGAVSGCYFGSVYATFGPATLAFFETIGALATPDGGSHPPVDAGWPFDANGWLDAAPSGAGGFGVGGWGGSGWGTGGRTAGAAGDTSAGGAGGDDALTGETNTTGCACRMSGGSENDGAPFAALGLVLAWSRARLCRSRLRGSHMRNGGRRAGDLA